jgi:MFS family permease
LLTNSRQSAWFFGNCIAVLIGGVIAYGIGTINTSVISHWKLLFLILGAVTSAYGIVLFVLLPDSPSKAIFLKPNERAIAVQRTLKNKTGVMDTGVFRWSQALQAIKDPQTWLLVLNSFASNLANGGLTSVSVYFLVPQVQSLRGFSLRPLSPPGSGSLTSRPLSCKCLRELRRSCSC